MTCSAKSLAVVLFAVAGLALAAPADAAPPVNRDCDADFPANQYNDRLDCKTENVNAATFAYVDSVLEHDRLRRALGGAPIFTDAQTEQLLAGRDRAQNAKDRTHQAQMFRGAVKKQKAEDEDCYVQEVIGDTGGPHGGDDVQPCTQGEDCAEVSGDGIGNDDGVCKLNGANREVCVQVCQQPLPSDEEGYDPSIAADTEQGLAELEVVLNDATDEMKKATKRMLGTFAARPIGRAVSECDQYQFDLFPGEVALQAAQAVKNTTSGAFNACSVVCQQDAFGWNCHAACLGIAIVDWLANIVNDGLDVRDGANGGAQLDRVARCTTELSNEIASISAGVGGTQASLDEVNTRLDAIELSLAALNEAMTQRFDGVDEQLCTPQGQRQCFPRGAAASVSDETVVPGSRSGRRK